MKNAIKLLGVIAVVVGIGFSIVSCDNGSSSRDSGAISTSVGSGGVVYEFDFIDANRSVARNAQPGGVFILYTYEPERINNQNKYILQPSTKWNVIERQGARIKASQDSTPSKEIWINTNGNSITHIEGLANNKDGPLAPIGQNTFNIDGAWYYYETGSGNNLLSTMVINGNSATTLTVGGYHYSNNGISINKDDISISKFVLNGLDFTFSDMIQYRWEWDPPQFGAPRDPEQSNPLSGKFELHDNGNTLKAIVGGNYHVQQLSRVQINR